MNALLQLYSSNIAQLEEYLYNQRTMYFCAQVITGKEIETKASIEHLLEGQDQETVVWFPTKETREKRKGIESTVSKPLFAGYLFIYWDGEKEIDFPLIDIRRLTNVIRFLRYNSGAYALQGKDLEFAKWIHMHRGNIKRSKVIFKEGQRVHICEGPLTGFDGNVIKVDKHHKKITLGFDFAGKVTPVVFSVDFLSSYGQTDAPSLSKL